jgi:hypothetical protein
MVNEGCSGSSASMGKRLESLGAIYGTALCPSLAALDPKLAP